MGLDAQALQKSWFCGSDYEEYLDQSLIDKKEVKYIDMSMEHFKKLENLIGTECTIDSLALQKIILCTRISSK